MTLMTITSVLVSALDNDDAGIIRGNASSGVLSENSGAVTYQILASTTRSISDYSSCVPRCELIGESSFAFT